MCVCDVFLRVHVCVYIYMCVCVYVCVYCVYVCACVIFLIFAAAAKASTPAVSPASSLKDMGEAIKLEDSKDDTNV